MNFIYKEINGLILSNIIELYYRDARIRSVIIFFFDCEIYLEWIRNGRDSTVYLPETLDKVIENRLKGFVTTNRSRQDATVISFLTPLPYPGYV